MNSSLRPGPLRYRRSAWPAGLLCVLLHLVPAAAAASDPDPLAEQAAATAPELSSAATGGFWQHEGVDGSIRVLVFSGGFEHVSSRVFLQWLGTPGPDAPASLVAGVEVGELEGLYALDQPRIERLPDGRHRIDLSGIQVYSRQSVDLVIQTAEPGQYQMVPIETAGSGN